MLFVLLNTLYGCSVKWTDAIQLGKVEQRNFNTEIEFEIKIGLVIVPVIINGENYNFLLDTEAPFSISEKLQNKLGYKNRYTQFLRK